MELIILIGLQASGKSTFYRTHFLTTHAYVSKDLLRNNRRPARRQHQLLQEALEAGHSVVVDNTNPTLEDRAPIIELAKHYNVPVSGYYFPPDVARNLERNNARTGKDRVPPVAIFSTLKRLQPPTYTEGFTHLYQVHTQDNFTFCITPWLEGDG